MLRGRHRGLPDALDRAVLLPREFKKRPDEAQPAYPEDNPIHSVPQLPEADEGASSSQSSHTQEGSREEPTEKVG